MSYFVCVSRIVYNPALAWILFLLMLSWLRPGFICTSFSIVVLIIINYCNIVCTSWWKVDNKNKKQYFVFIIYWYMCIFSFILDFFYVQMNIHSVLLIFFMARVKLYMLQWQIYINELENKIRQFWFSWHMLSDNGQTRPYLE